MGFLDRLRAKRAMRSIELSGDEQPTIPVGPDVAARRLLCLNVFVNRTKIEGMAKAADAPRVVMTKLKEAADHLAEWLRALGLLDSLSRKERALSSRRVGSWPEQDFIDGIWRQEAYDVLAWALGLRSVIAPYDQSAIDNPDESGRDVAARAEDLLSSARLRPEVEIAKARDTAEFWLWRARTYRIVHMPKLPPTVPKGFPFDEVVVQAARKGEEDGLFVPINDDFPAFGKAYRDLDADEASLMESIARERLYALNWLCGDCDDWDEVGTST